MSNIYISLSLGIYKLQGWLYGNNNQLGYIQVSHRDSLIGFLAKNPSAKLGVIV